MNVNIFSVGGYGATYLGGSGIVNALFFTGADTSAVTGYSNCDVVLGSTPSNDMIIRIDRDLVNSQVRGEVFDTATGAQIGQTCAYNITSQATGTAIQSAGIALGESRAGPLGGSIAFLRWYNSSVPAGTTPAVGIPVPATLGDWEFDNSPSDSSGNGRAFSGISSYTTTPIYNPACLPGAPQTVRIGSSLSLSAGGSYALDGGTALTYAWTYFAGSDGVNQNPTLTAADLPDPRRDPRDTSPMHQHLTLTGASAPNVIVSGLNQFGSADFQLAVTDGSGNTTSCSVHNGVVIADANGVVSLTSEGVDPVSQKFIGPLIMYGANPWPWADTLHMAEMNLQVNNLANYYTPFWRTAQPGTIGVTAGSTTITGSGTDLTAPCGGGSAPLNGAAIFLIYPGTDGLTHYLNGGVSSCTDANHLEFQMPKGGGYPVGTPQLPYPTCSPSCSGWKWSWGYYGDTIRSPQDQLGYWLYNSAPANYYDNAKAFYALYLRSGIDTYLTAFQNLADEWWEFPVMDQGYACNTNDSACWAPTAWRSMSLNGVVLRALEEGSGTTKWAGLWVVAQLAQAYMGNLAASPYSSLDERETGYVMSMLAYCALADPDPTHQASCKSTIKSSLANVWTRTQRPDIGNVWGEFEYSTQIPANQATSIPLAGGAGSVCLINGSATVTGTGTNWTSAANGFEIWFFGGDPTVGPATNAAGDGVGYGATTTGHQPDAYLGLCGPYRMHGRERVQQRILVWVSAGRHYAHAH